MINIQQIVEEYVERANGDDNFERNDYITGLIVEQIIPGDDIDIAEVRQQVEEGIAATYMSHLFVAASLLAMHAY